MSIKEYDILSENEDIECSICNTTEDITFDEDGGYICIECLFEKECETIYDSKGKGVTI